MLVRLLAGALVCLVVVRTLGVERGSLLALLMGVLPLVLLPAYALLAYAVLRRQVLLIAVGTGLVVAHLLVLAPTLGAAPLPPGAADAPRLRVVVANLYVLNPNPEQAGRALLAARPDVLVVPELTREGLFGLEASGLLAALPFSVVDLEGREEGTGLFSRLPLTETSSRKITTRSLPRATVEVGGVAVRLLAAHPLPPVPVAEPLWRLALADLFGEVAGTDLPVVVAGDLNADRDHAPFRALLDSGLRDAHDERGRGLARTFPAGLPLLHLDHVLVRDGRSGRLAVLSVRELDVPGSDHLGVVTDLAVLPR